MEEDNRVICKDWGTDPKGVFGTTLNLEKKFGKKEFLISLLENAVTGICVGLALGGYKPV